MLPYLHTGGPLKQKQTNKSKTAPCCGVQVYTLKGMSHNEGNKQAQALLPVRQRNNEMENRSLLSVLC